MTDGLRGRLGRLAARARRFERREVRELRVWLETTRNLVHVSVALLVPLVIGAVTWLSNSISTLPFLLFPPLASGTYMLFANPESRGATPRRFVGGLTAGALCGFLALEIVGRLSSPAGQTQLHVSAEAAALSVFLTAVVTWALDVEVSQAFSTALLVLVTDVSGELLPRAEGATAGEYVLSVFAGAVIVSGVFVFWRDRFYERRARYLYRSTRGDDHVLVPMRGDHPDRTAVLGARIAAAHDAGKVVLLDVVDDEAVAAAERALIEDEAMADAGPDAEAPLDRDAESAPGAAAPTDADGSATAAAVDIAERGPGEGPGEEPPDNPAEERAVADAAARLEAQAERIETKVGVPCEVVVAVDGDTAARTTLGTAAEANCDLVVAPYEERHGRLSPFVRDLFRSDADVLVHRAASERARWQRVLVPVRSPSDVAHAMIDFARRLSGRTGRVAVCHCLGGSGDRRRAESMLADLVETFDGNIETRVSGSPIEAFLRNTAGQYDFVIIGASRDRSAASRFVSPPTFERIQELDADVAIMDR